jgi:hypothetical protein
LEEDVRESHKPRSKFIKQQGKIREENSNQWVKIKQQPEGEKKRAETG